MGSHLQNMNDELLTYQCNTRVIIEKKSGCGETASLNDQNLHALTFATDEFS